MGEGDTQISRDFTLSLVLVVVVVLIFGGCAKNYYSARECPVGYDLISSYPTPEFETYCGSFDEQKVNDYRCCQRKSNANEICRYDLDEKEMISCQDFAGDFRGLIDQARTCKADTPCGTVDSTLRCAGVACEEDNLCLISVQSSQLVGNCVDKLNIAKGQITAEVYVLSKEGLLCGQIKDTTMGTECNEQEKNLGLSHCIFNIANPTNIISGCRGAI